MKAVSTLLLLLGLLAVNAYALGTISVSFSSEDPTGFSADAVLVIGESIDATFTLSPAPSFPIRLDIVSTLPNIIYPTHDRINYNPSRSPSGVVTLESPEMDGDIGYATIIVEAETPGLYAPLVFTVLVQGQLSSWSPSNCIGAGVASQVNVMLDPQAPKILDFDVSSTNGNVSPNVVEIVNGQDMGSTWFTGSSIGAGSVTFNNELYVVDTFTFNVMGSITTDMPDTVLEGVPYYVTVSTFNPISSGSVQITVTATNAEVSPSSFTLDSTTTWMNVSFEATTEGKSVVTYSASGYCDHVDTVTVTDGLLCSIGFHTNIDGDACALCPGNYNTSCASNFANTCNLQGFCDYSFCNRDAVKCDCLYPFEGYACQWDPTSTSQDYQKASLGSTGFTFSFSNVAATTGDITLTAPDNLIQPYKQIGEAYTSLYSSVTPFFGAVDPSSVNPPDNTWFSGISFVFETTCDDNTNIEDAFWGNRSVTAFFPIDIEVIDQESMTRLYLYWWDSQECEWVDAISMCPKAQQLHTVDYHANTVTTAFCFPGQYALYENDPVTAPSTTGYTNDPHPDPRALSAAVLTTTGQTGYLVPPPTPLPYFYPNDNYDPSPPRKPNVETFSSSSSSASVLSVSVLMTLVLALLMVL